MENALLDRLRSLADALEEAVDHIETLEAIVEILERKHPETVDCARAEVAVAKKDQHL